ncbi:hypothetical protein BH20ACI1_BH20ACI1_08740 [soil metagenome]
MNKKLIAFFVVLLLGNLVCLAQTARENPKPGGLALEIVFRKENKPAYLTVPETDKAKASGVWFARFGRVQN